MQNEVSPAGRVKEPVKLTKVLQNQLVSCVGNLWSYSANCMKEGVEGETVDADLFSSSIALANALIKDITTYLDSETVVFKTTIMQVLQVNAFVEEKLKRTVVKIDI